MTALKSNRRGSRRNEFHPLFSGNPWERNLLSAVVSHPPRRTWVADSCGTFCRTLSLIFLPPPGVKPTAPHKTRQTKSSFHRCPQGGAQRVALSTSVPNVIIQAIPARATCSRRAQSVYHTGVGTLSLPDAQDWRPSTWAGLLRVQANPPAGVAPPTRPPPSFPPRLLQ